MFLFYQVWRHWHFPVQYAWSCTSVSLLIPYSLYRISASSLIVCPPPESHIYFVFPIVSPLWHMFTANAPINPCLHICMILFYLIIILRLLNHHHCPAYTIQKIGCIPFMSLIKDWRTTHLNTPELFFCSCLTKTFWEVGCSQEEEDKVWRHI